MSIGRWIDGYLARVALVVRQRHVALIHVEAVGDRSQRHQHHAAGLPQRAAGERKGRARAADGHHQGLGLVDEQRPTTLGQIGRVVDAHVGPLGRAPSSPQLHPRVRLAPSAKPAVFM